MAKNQTIILTPEGYDQIQRELKELKEEKRPEVIERIKRAKEFGDLSENAEYQTAKEDQSFIEGRIQELETMLKLAKVVEPKHNGSNVGVGSTVTVAIDGDSVTYSIVGPAESDPDNGKISSESPVARALLGHKKGDTVTVTAPGGDVEYTIAEVK